MFCFQCESFRVLSWQDLAAAAWLATVLLFHQLKGIWNVPANLDFMARLFLIGIASWTWTFIRIVPELGYEFSFSAKTFGVAGLNFVLFAAIAIPASLLMGFTHWNPRAGGTAAFFIGFVEIFLFIALLEELFFRGFLQTLISASLHSTWKGQAVVSCLFGLFHILHDPFPNWKYVFLATVAGWFYGSAFVKAGNLMASTLTHALVDTVWRNFF
jgi:membrane protease YdiL (CAAX protease family)